MLKEATDRRSKKIEEKKRVSNYCGCHLSSADRAYKEPSDRFLKTEKGENNENLGGEKQRRPQPRIRGANKELNRKRKLYHSHQNQIVCYAAAK